MKPRKEGKKGRQEESKARSMTKLKVEGPTKLWARQGGVGVRMKREGPHACCVN